MQPKASTAVAQADDEDAIVERLQVPDNEASRKKFTMRQRAQKKGKGKASNGPKPKTKVELPLPDPVPPPRRAAENGRIPEPWTSSFKVKPAPAQAPASS